MREEEIMLGDGCFPGAPLCAWSCGNDNNRWCGGGSDVVVVVSGKYRARIGFECFSPSLGENIQT